ncbi:MAG: DNA repair protein RecO [Selenomonadaceae bacterium]|nr:DNA repair protein RecO [Selenomonadaceae bacterium]MBR1858165.1 DNA repair protein RecO [Selenomonadaceae bacterium]
MERFFKTEAVVLLTNDFGDANRVVTFFTKNYGKIEANAYGCRRAKNKISGAMQVFNHISLEFIKGNIYTVHEADVISFYKINEDLNRLAYASVFFEIVNRMTVLEEVDTEVFYLLLKSLEAFDKRNPRIALLLSTCQFIELSGFSIKYPESMRNLFLTLSHFDWKDTSKFVLKSGELFEAESFLMNYIQSDFDISLNSLKFLKMINSIDKINK